MEDCLYKAKWGMKEHVELLRERGLPTPDRNLDPKIVIQNAREDATAWVASWGFNRTGGDDGRATYG